VPLVGLIKGSYHILYLIEYDLIKMLTWFSTPLMFSPMSTTIYVPTQQGILKEKFSTPLGWFYFLLYISITITNCNSSTSDVGGSLLPRPSE
jgi:hypothetical protein